MVNAVIGVDTVARLAGDEFVIVLEALANGSDDVRIIATKIIEVAAKPFNFKSRRGVTSV